MSTYELRAVTFGERMTVIWKKVKLISLSVVFTIRLPMNPMQTASQKCAILFVCIKTNYQVGCKQLIVTDEIRFVDVFNYH